MTKNIMNFYSLYKIYEHNLYQIADKCPSQIETIDISKESAKSKYIIKNFGNYFAKVDGEYSDINYDSQYYIKSFNLAYISLTSGIKLWAHKPYSENAKIYTFFEPYTVYEEVIHNCSDAMEIIKYYEQSLRTIYNLFTDELIEALQTTNMLYPSKLLELRYLHPQTSMQFVSSNKIIRHMTALSGDIPVTEERIRMIYNQFTSVIIELSKVGIDYGYFYGTEVVLTKFEVEKKDYTWSDISWDKLSMIRSLSNNGAYIPFLIEGDEIPILSDGIHRFDSLKHIKDLYVLYMNLSNVNGDTKLTNCMIELDSELFNNCTWKNSMKIISTGNGFKKISVPDLHSLICAFFLLFREINNFADDGLLNNIPESKIINKRR